MSQAPSSDSVDAVEAARVGPIVPDRTPAALLTATRRAVTRALAEDLGDIGDLTSRATVPANMVGEAEIVAREEGVISGLSAVVETFAAVDPRIVVDVQVADGDRVIRDQVIAVVSGPMRALLTGERTALNFLGHLSGIATATAKLQDLINGTGCVIRDTRKTTPGLRLLEKAAVRDGGGDNHRIGLFDAILVKENHVLAAGGLNEVIANLRAAHPDVPVQIEVETVEQLWRLLELGVKDILLDNFTVEEVRHAAARIDGRARLEVSGNIDASTVRAYADAIGPGGRLAVGALTHSSPALDVAMDVVDHQRPEPMRRSLADEEARQTAPPPQRLFAPAGVDGGPLPTAPLDGRAPAPFEGDVGSALREAAADSASSDEDEGQRPGFGWRQSGFRQRRARGD